MRKWVACAALATALVVGAVDNRVATADDYGTANFSTGTGPLPDSANHSYCWGGGFDVALRDNADYAMEYSIGYDTDMTRSFESTCTRATDLVWFDADLAGNIRGQFTCGHWLSATVCGQGTATLDPAELNEGSNDEQDTTKTACHEAGHSVGLTHADSSSDCMRNGEVPNTNLQYRRYNDHHKGHINAQF